MSNSSRSAQTKSAQSTRSTQPTDDVSYQILDIKSWNPKLYKPLVEAKPNKNGQGNTAGLTYDGKRIYLKTPKMYLPFGASLPKVKPGEKPSNQWTIQMAMGETPDLQQFQLKAKDFDDFFVDYASQPEISFSWLKSSKAKPFSKDVVQSKYTNMLKYPKTKEGEIDSRYPPFIRVQVPTTYENKEKGTKAEIACEIYDHNNQPILASLDPNSRDLPPLSKVITPGMTASTLLQANGVWCTNAGFGVTWKIAQIKLFPAKGLPKGQCLVNDPESDADADDDTETTDSSQSKNQSSDQNGEATGSGDSEHGDETVDVEVDIVDVEDESAPIETTPAVAPVPVVVASQPKVGLSAKKIVAPRK